MTRSSFRLAALLVCGLLISPAQAQEKIRLTHSTGGFSYIPVFVAEALNYFKEVGLDVRMLRTDSGPKSVAAVISGDADVFMGSTLTPIEASKAGADIQLFAAILTQYSSDVFVSRKWADDHKITDASSFEDRLAALKGLTIGVTGAGSGTDQIIRYLAGVAGLRPDRDLTIVSLGNNDSAMMAALSRGQVQGLSKSSPTFYLAAREYDARMLFQVSTGAVKSLDGYFQVGAAARRKWLDEHESAATKFVKAVQMGLDAMRDPALNVKARDAVQALYYRDLDPDLFKRAWEDLDKSAPRTAAIDERMVREIIEFRNRFAREALDPGIAGKTFTNRYVRQALEQMGR